MPAWRVRTVFTGVQGSPWLSTLYFGTSGTAADAVTAVGVFWSAVDGLMASTVNWTTEADVEEIGVGGDLISVDQTTPAAGSGSATASTLLPPATQGLIRWRTGAVFGNRELKGRTFIPGLTEGDSTDGLLTSASRTTIQNAASALIADVNSALIVWSRRYAQQILVATATVPEQFAVLRSRRD